MATRTNPRRLKHRKQNSLTSYDSAYDKRHIHYAASPTPGNSASRHHRRNSLKAKQLNLMNYNSQNLNIKFKNEEMNKANDRKAPISESNESIKYKINLNPISTASKSSQSAATNTKRKELKEWEERLKITENEMNSVKSKNTQFIQSLQKQIESLTVALNEERNKTKQHRLSADELSELDAIKRENSTLRGTIRRMRDEMQVIKSHANIDANKAQQNVHNNYYINAINYNNIVNNHSNVNFESQENGILSIESLSLREMERDVMKRKNISDEKEKKLTHLWNVYREQKSALDSDRNSLALGQRELFRNNRRLKMKLQQLNLLKHGEIESELPKLLEINGINDNNHNPQQHIGRFSSIKLKSIKKHISNEHSKRKQNVNNLKNKFEAFKDKMNEMENDLKKWMETEKISHKKYSQTIYDIIEKYLANKKKDNALIRRFDTKQFDPIDVNKIMRMKSEESEEEPLKNKKVTKHQTQFSFERNMSFDISDLENELIEHKEEAVHHPNGVNVNGDDAKLEEGETIPVFNRKRTMSMKLDEKHLPNEKKEKEKEKEVDVNKNYKFDDMDLLRIISQIENENDALREEISGFKCDNFSLESKCFCLSYDKQLLLEQIDELNEVNAELVHKMKEMTECQRDSGILRHELLNKDREISIKHEALRDIYTKYDKMKIIYDAQCELIEEMKKEKEVCAEYWNEYLWKEWQCIKHIDSICDGVAAKKVNATNIESIIASIDIADDDNWSDIKSKHKLMQKVNDLARNKFEFPPIIKKYDAIVMKLVKILLSSSQTQNNGEYEAEAQKAHKFEVESLKKVNESLAASLMRCEVEREDIYSLFSSYKKRVKNLESELKTLKVLEIEHQQIAQQLSQTQNELETEQKNYRKFKLKTERKLSAMSEIEAQHRKLSSASFAKQRLDSLLGQSQEILRNYGEKIVRLSEDDEEEEEDGVNNDDDNELYYGADTEYNADTMLIVHEEEEEEKEKENGRSSSMVINDDVIQNSKIQETHLSKDIDIEIYGFDVDILSPLRSDDTSANAMPKFDFNPQTNTSTARKHWPQDSFIAMAPDIKKQILDKKGGSGEQFEIIYDEYSGANTARRNTVDRYIESRDEMENDKEIQIISEQETQILSPGASPLTVIDNENDNNLQKKFDVTYRAILEGKAHKFNSNQLNVQNIELDPDDDDDDGDDDDDIYGEYGDKQEAHKKNNSSSLSSVASHHSHGSHASDGYLELSDTMKISREQFQELRNQHHMKLVHNQLSEIHEMEREMHKKNESIDVVQEYQEEEIKTDKKVGKKHKRNATTVVHIADVPHFDNNRVRGSHHINNESDDDKKVDPPSFSVVNNHKTSSSIVSEHGTHYISYENDTPRAANCATPQSTFSSAAAQQAIDDIINKNQIDMAAINAIK